MSVAHVNTHTNEAPDGATPRPSSKSLRGVMFGLTGVGLLASLLIGVPVDEVMAAVESMGASMALVLMVAPLWFVANAMSLRSLLGPEAPIARRELVKTQIIGDGLSALLPLAGVGGEPFKLGHLSRWAPAGRVSLALVYDRLAHVVSGLLYLAALMAASAWWLELPAALEWGFALGAVALTATGATLMALTGAALPGATAWLARRVKLLRHIHEADTRIDGQTLARALGYKLLARLAHVPELWLIAVLMGLTGDPGQVALIGAMLTGSTFLFFVVPGGVGVNEAGVAGAFALLGLPTHLGVAFGLVRRARVLSWAAVGVTLWAGAGVARRLLGHLTSNLCPTAASAAAPDTRSQP